MDLDTFREYFFGNPKNIEKNMHFLFHNIESFSEKIIPELLRFIEVIFQKDTLSALDQWANGIYEQTREIEPSFDSRSCLEGSDLNVFYDPSEMSAHIFSLHKSYCVPFYLSQDFASISAEPSFGEVVYRVTEINWKEIELPERWDSFFNGILDNAEEIPSFLLDYVFNSQNCSSKQLLTATSVLAKTENDLQLIFHNAIQSHRGNIFERVPRNSVLLF